MSEHKIRPIPMDFGPDAARTARLVPRKGVRLVSDGTSTGTRLFGPDGEPMNLDCAKSVTWRCSGREVPIVTVEYFAFGQPVDLRQEESGREEPHNDG